MGLFDDVAGKSIDSALSSSSSPLAANLLQMINQHPGGISGLIQACHEKGLGELVTSWVGTGENLPISSEQIQHLLGSDQVKELAAKAGISPDAAGSELSSLLPTLMDRLTPNGAVPQHGNLMDAGMDLLKSLSNKGTNAA